MTVTEVAFAAAISVVATKQVVNQSGENPVNSYRSSESAAGTGCYRQ
jgi:hypothetical protein